MKLALNGLNKKNMPENLELKVAEGNRTPLKNLLSGTRTLY